MKTLNISFTLLALFSTGSAFAEVKMNPELSEVGSLKLSNPIKPRSHGLMQDQRTGEFYYSYDFLKSLDPNLSCWMNFQLPSSLQKDVQSYDPRRGAVIGRKGQLDGGYFSKAFDRFIAQNPVALEPGKIKITKAYRNEKNRSMIFELEHASAKGLSAERMECKRLDGTLFELADVEKATHGAISPSLVPVSPPRGRAVAPGRTEIRAASAGPSAESSSTIAE